MQRNLRPPLLTSMNFIGVRHFEQAGGGGFLGIRYWTLVWRTKRVNSAERQREPEADEFPKGFEARPLGGGHALPLFIDGSLRTGTQSLPTD
jgi:hypothetical protein